MWAAAQLLALAALVSTVAGLPVGTTLLAVTVLVTAYTLIGGLLASVVTDIFQSAVVLVGLVILLIALIDHAGGPAMALASIRPEQLILIAPGKAGWRGWTRLPFRSSAPSWRRS